MGQQVVGQKNRLSVLQVRTARHGSIRVGCRLSNECLDNSEHLLGNDA